MIYKSNAKAVFIGLLLLTLSFTINLSSLKAQQYQTQQIVGGLAFPNFVTSARDGSGRLFIVLKGGVIKVHNPATGATTDFLDITSRVLSVNNINSERGLLGLAFHPQYGQNRRFFVYYTRVPDGAIQIAEYKVSASNPNVAETTEKPIITIPHAENSNHNGGTVAFGPDGYLYFAPGDGGSQNDPPNNAQNINVLLGKMLRIDVNVPEGSNQPYLIPPDNPFAGATPGADEIYAYGLRNPYRFSFDRGGSQRLFIADVGQNQIEEINIGERGANYGWRAYEGNNCTGLNPEQCTGGANPINYTVPVYTYAHTAPANNPTRCSITGGYAYRGTRRTFPLGAYIFADYCTGEIGWIQHSGMIVIPSFPLIDTSFLITSFGEDDQGEIYFTTNSATGGTVQKIVNTNSTGPQAKVADFDGDGRTDLSVTRNTSGSKFWYTQGSSGFRGTQWGVASDIPVPADYDGDGKTDIAVFRDGFWYWLESSTNTFRYFQFGSSGAVPLPADYDGDGKADFAVGGGGLWRIYNSATNTTRADYFGNGGDIFVPADYDGDGRADLAVVRGSSWHFLRSRDGAASIEWGAVGDIPVPGDYDGDGKVDAAVFRPGASAGSPAFWYILQSSNNQSFGRQWGTNGDEPVPGDYDGDGRTDIAVTRTVSGSKVWYILNSNSGTFRGEFFGVSTDTPIPPADKP
ncbi:MAG TPA: PQQ-dependent sugar dehydrogenase [Pyrinomonadaceae bacterium]|jgi:glucose/arabinose dehydrogenase